MSDAPLKEAIQRKYGDGATQAGGGVDRQGCCGTSGGCSDPITSNLYATEEVRNLPEAAVAASLGSGNPTALIDLHDGDVVLDLGSGGGIDALLSARRVAPSGKV